MPVIIVLVANIAERLESGNMVNIQLTPKLLLCDTAMAATMAVTLARKLRLAFPVWPVIFDVTAFPVVMILASALYGSLCNHLICFCRQSFVPGGAAFHNKSFLPAAGIKETSMRAILSLATGFYMEGVSALFAMSSRSRSLSQSRTFKAAIPTFFGASIDLELFAAPFAYSLPTFLAGFLLTRPAAMFLWLAGFSKKVFAAIFANRLNHKKYLLSVVDRLLVEGIRSRIGGKVNDSRLPASGQQMYALDRCIIAQAGGLS